MAWSRDRKRFVGALSLFLLWVVLLGPGHRLGVSTGRSLRPAQSAGCLRRTRKCRGREV